MPPVTEAPMQLDPITECGSRPSGFQGAFQLVQRDAGLGQHLLSCASSSSRRRRKVLSTITGRS
jgi:hypothetical protein